MLNDKSAQDSTINRQTRQETMPKEMTYKYAEMNCQVNNTQSTTLPPPPPGANIGTETWYITKER